MKLYATKSKETKQNKSLKSLKTERYLKIHALTRPIYVSKAGEKRQYKTKEVPQLRINGKWLEAAGFKIGGQVKIEVSEGQLVIRLVEEETNKNSRA